MGKIQLKLPPSLAMVLEAQVSDWFILDKEIGEEATLGSLLTGLALNYHNFRKSVFNPDTRKVSEQVDIILNDQLLPSADVMETKLSDGDSVMIIPVYSGG